MKIPEILIIETVHQPGSLAKVLQVIAEAGLTIEHLIALRRAQGHTLWEITLEMGALLQGLVMLYLGGRIGMEAGEFRSLCHRSFGRYFDGIRG